MLHEDFTYKSGRVVLLMRTKRKYKGRAGLSVCVIEFRCYRVNQRPNDFGTKLVKQIIYLRLWCMCIELLSTRKWSGWTVYPARGVWTWHNTACIILIWWVFETETEGKIPFWNIALHLPNNLLLAHPVGPLDHLVYMYYNSLMDVPFEKLVVSMVVRVPDELYCRVGRTGWGLIPYLST